MKRIALTAMLCALLATFAQAGSLPSGPKVGDIFEISLTRDTASRDNRGGSSSTHGKSTIWERVVGVREDGLELEYDHPGHATPQERARDWQFPVRVFRPRSGPLQLLNRPELEARVDPWLKLAGLPRSACGRLIFTWTAFRIDCDPASAIALLEPFDLPASDLRDGAPYRDPDAGGPAPLTRATTAGPAGGAAFTARLAVDPGKVHRMRAETDVGVGEIMNAPVTLEAALAKQAARTVTGTIVVTLDTDPAGNVRRRTKITTLETKGPGALTETETITETLERRQVAGPNGR